MILEVRSSPDHSMIFHRDSILQQLPPLSKVDLQGDPITDNIELNVDAAKAEQDGGMKIIGNGELGWEMSEDCWDQMLGRGKELGTSCCPRVRATLMSHPTSPLLARHWWFQDGHSLMAYSLTGPTLGDHNLGQALVSPN